MTVHAVARIGSLTSPDGVGNYDIVLEINTFDGISNNAAAPVARIPMTLSRNQFNDAIIDFIVDFVDTEFSQTVDPHNVLFQTFDKG